MNPNFALESPGAAGKARKSRFDWLWRIFRFIGRLLTATPFGKSKQFRNEDGSVGTRNILAITTTVQCVAGVVEFAVKRIKDELLPKYPNVDDVVGLEHTYGCGVAIDAPDAIVPIRTLRNITLNPNFGNEVMVVSLGCEKLQPERLLPPGTFTIVDERNVADVGVNQDVKPDVV
jgi:galactarate dehydratase